MSQLLLSIYETLEEYCTKPRARPKNSNRRDTFSVPEEPFARAVAVILGWRGEPHRGEAACIGKAAQPPLPALWSSPEEPIFIDGAGAAVTTRLCKRFGDDFCAGATGQKVEQSLQLLNEHAALNAEGLARLFECYPKRVTGSLLETCLSPAGSVRQRGSRLRHFLKFLQELEQEDGSYGPYGGGPMLPQLQAIPTDTLRDRLYGIRGIGIETTGALLLFAFDRPVFVMTGGVYRLLNRHGLVARETCLEEMDEVLVTGLSPSVDVCTRFYHNTARVISRFCLAGIPNCRDCPLGVFLDHAP